MFGLGLTEILLLILVAFLVFGPKQFPVVVRNFAKLFNELRQAFTEVKTEFEFTKASAEEELKKITKIAGKDLEFIKGLEETSSDIKNKLNQAPLKEKKE